MQGGLNRILTWRVTLVVDVPHLPVKREHVLIRAADLLVTALAHLSILALLVVRFALVDTPRSLSFVGCFLQVLNLSFGFLRLRCLKRRNIYSRKSNNLTWLGCKTAKNRDLLFLSNLPVAVAR